MLAPRIARTLGLAVALAGAIVVPAAGTLATFSYEAKWGTTGTGHGEFLSPIGATVGNGGVYVTEFTGDRIQVFDSDGTYWTQWGSSGSGSGQFNGPVDMAIDRWGNHYVLEYNGERVQVFDRERTYLGQWGGSGTGTGQFDGPLGIAIGPDGFVYVADGNNHRGQKFDGEGIFVDEWGSGGTGDGQFNRPWGIAVSPDRRVYVADYLNNRVQVFDTEGTFLFQFGSFGTGPGQLSEPTGLDLDPVGNVIVAEYNNARVSVFDPDGTFLHSFSGPGSADGNLAGPDGICVDGARNVFVPDYGNDRVQRFGWDLPTDVKSLSGSNRILTAVAASQDGWPDGLINRESGYRTAIVATAYNWPDALGGAGLAGAIDAPILLVEPDSLPAAVSTELQRLDAEQVYILGGTGAVSADVSAALGNVPGISNVERFGGSNRYETALLIAGEVTSRASYTGNMFVATGENFPDALAAAPVAAYNGWPIYLTPGDSLPASVKNAIVADTASDSWVLGGPGAVTDDVAQEIETALGGIDLDRISGTDRYRTALAVATSFDDTEWWSLDWSHPALATGANFPDALAGGPVQGRIGSPILLVSGSSLEGFVAAELAAHQDEIYEIRYLGGTAVISTATRLLAEDELW